MPEVIKTMDYQESVKMSIGEVIQEAFDTIDHLNGQPPEPQPRTIWPFSYNAEEVVTIYGALRAYLQILSQKPDENLETIARVARLMIAIKPQAVEASQEIAGRAAKDS